MEGGERDGDEESSNIFAEIPKVRGRGRRLRDKRRSGRIYQTSRTRLNLW